MLPIPMRRLEHYCDSLDSLKEVSSAPDAVLQIRCMRLLHNCSNLSIYVDLVHFCHYRNAKILTRKLRKTCYELEEKAREAAEAVDVAAPHRRAVGV